MKTKQEAEEHQKEALDVLSRLIENWLWAMSEEKWEVSYDIEYWDFRFVAKLGNFTRISPSLEWTRDENKIIHSLQNFSDQVIALWEKENNEKSIDVA